MNIAKGKPTLILGSSQACIMAIVLCIMAGEKRRKKQTREKRRMKEPRFQGRQTLCGWGAVITAHHSAIV